MPEPILMLRLEGPLQSWGGRSRWDVRETQSEPTKSGVIGLLGCALGYPVGDPRLETELEAGLRFGVRIEAPGRIVRDYQTVAGYLPTADGRYRHSGVKTGSSLRRLEDDPEAVPATIQSPRYYLEDAAFLVALGEAVPGSGLIARCADAVQNPRWPLYLGRKACVATRPIFESLAEYDSLEQALTLHPHAWLGANRKLRKAVAPPELAAFVEDPTGNLSRQDAVRTNAARVYGFRRARRLSVPFPAQDRSNMP